MFGACCHPLDRLQVNVSVTVLEVLSEYLEDLFCVLGGLGITGLYQPRQSYEAVTPDRDLGLGRVAGSGLVTVSRYFRDLLICT